MTPINKLVSISVLAMTAVLCFFSATDRAAFSSVRSPPLPMSRWFGSSYVRYQALSALHHGGSGRSWARLLVAAAPVERLSTSVFGWAALSTGAPTRADEAMRVAGQLGWRDRLTQLYWLQVGLTDDDPHVAAERVDALLRVGASAEGEAAVRRLEQMLGGPAALAKRLKFNPSWASDYIEGLQSLNNQGIDTRIKIVGAARRGALPDKVVAVAAAAASQGLLQNARAAAAYHVWTAFEGTGDITQTGFWQSRFGKILAGDTKAPFEWHPIIGPSVELRAPAVGEPDRLFVQASAASAEPIAFQIIRHSPGPVALAWEGAGGTPLSIRITCTSGVAMNPEPVLVQGINQTQNYLIPDNCPTQLAEIIAEAPTTAAEEGWISSPRILMVSRRFPVANKESRSGH